MASSTQSLTSNLFSEDGSMRVPPNHYVTLAILSDCFLKTSPFNVTKAGASLNGQFYQFPGDKTAYYNAVTENFHLTAPFLPHDGYGASEMLLYSSCYQALAQEILDVGWDIVLPNYDHLSFFDWLQTSCNWSSNVIEYYAYETAYEAYMSQSLWEGFREIAGQWFGPEGLVQVDNGLITLAEAILRGTDIAYGGSCRGAGDWSLSKNIRYGAAVIKVQQNDNGSLTTYYTNVNGNSQTVTSDYVINTVPLPVVSHQNFFFANNSDISHDFRTAARVVHYADASKVFLQFRDKNWFSNNGFNGGMYVTDMVSQTMYFGDHYPQDPERIVYLIGYDWQRAASDVGFSDQQMTTRIALKDLARTRFDPSFESGMLERLESSHIHFWLNAFNIFEPCEYSRYFNTMLTPQLNETLFFAGEHNSWSHAWIQGALESGLSTAYRISCLLSNTTCTPAPLSNNPNHVVGPNC